MAQNLLFRELAQTFASLEATSSSLKMIDILANFFRKVSPEEGRIASYLIKGEIEPEYKGLELGLASKLVSRAIGKAVNKSQEEVEKIFKETGDLGDTAFRLLGNQKGKGLKVKEVYQKLKEIALASGEGSQERKINLLSELLKNSSSLEAKYIVRLVLGVLRLGVADMTLLYGISKGLFGTKEKKSILEKAYNLFPDIGEVTYKAIKEGLKSLEKAKPILGIPTRMMLASRIEELEEVKEHISGKVLVEYKYDGERLQAHISPKEIIFYSRRHENITHQFPDVKKWLREAFLGKEGILEGEVVPYDKKTGKLLPFQILMQRRRKYDVEEYAKKIPVKYFLFDILSLNGSSLIEKPLSERKEILKKVIKENQGVVLGEYIVTEDIEEMKDFFERVMGEGAEGVMIKDAKSDYEAGTRGWKWIKFKKEYKEELADTFDVVVVGAFFGTGRRAGSYGSLLVSAFDPQKNSYPSFTKVGAGFTDKDLEELPKILKPFLIEKKHRLVETEMEADLWFEPRKVIEISGAELTISPVHMVAKDKIKKGGLALRFPKFLRWREDKGPEDATTVDEIYQIYQQRQRISK